MACFRQQYGRRIRFGARGVEDTQVRIRKLVGLEIVRLRVAGPAAMAWRAQCRRT